jgi:hypothetical protein
VRNKPSATESWHLLLPVWGLAAAGGFLGMWADRLIPFTWRGGIFVVTGVVVGAGTGLVLGLLRRRKQQLRLMSDTSHPPLP